MVVSSYMCYDSILIHVIFMLENNIEYHEIESNQ